MIEDDGAREAKVRQRRRRTGRHGARRETRHDTKHSDAEGGVGGDVSRKRREGWGATGMSRTRAPHRFRGCHSSRAAEVFWLECEGSGLPLTLLSDLHLHWLLTCFLVRRADWSIFASARAGHGICMFRFATLRDARSSAAQFSSLFTLLAMGVALQKHT